MTTSQRRPGRAVKKIQLNQIFAVIAIVAVFIGAAVWGGLIGGLIIAALASGAALLLAVRWNALDARIRIVRLIAVVAVYAVAISVIARG